MTVLCIDTNLGLEHARRIGRDEKCYYALVTYDPYPKLEDLISGYGFTEIVKVDDWGNVVGESDVVVFLDSGFGGWADYLRKEGKAVFGADRRSERLELDRVYARKVNEELGIKMAEGAVVKGIDAVVDYVSKAGKRVFVKISRVRGNIETFGTKDPNEAELMLRQGGFAVIGDEVEFVLEHELEGVEVGIDTFVSAEGFLDVVFETIELKGCGNVTKVMRRDKSLWSDVLDKLEGYLVKNGYRGMFCMEGFFDGSDVYVTDYTPRFPYICSYAYPRLIANFTEVIKGVANGEDVRIRTVDRYSAQIGVYTDLYVWRKIEILNEKYVPNVAFRRVIFKDGSYWYVPDDPVVCVGIWNSLSLLDAIDRAFDVVENVRCASVYSQGMELRFYIQAMREKLMDMGVRW